MHFPVLPDGQFCLIDRRFIIDATIEVLLYPDNKDTSKNIIINKIIFIFIHQ